ncbi:hypothetical protein [Novosphingobium sp. MD-1]|uniref:hypothetical protein n=1 Tax=Novosphingobium sp. MD-1 TaxID=1630648 RepID=UPI001F347476|nr:hypothetical protein [Novosphingobium sp. MD-1]
MKRTLSVGSNFSVPRSAYSRVLARSGRPGTTFLNQPSARENVPATRSAALSPSGTLTAPFTSTRL